ncbi:flagellar export protein FliJ [Pseudomarimonas salicorniae]|uniref:Flagellar FliJ protein n=1 Tax=Pseudomarimonas salicorniae TaxID=2933270 RepID=A0ABT0GKS5_9GAMM|nr:flagellar export protein FliJ [Lysobacter sp. CAU 1642]MCK7595147.1 flagellar export protein FliJ [Lysobacter sp. CAU 1642]
MNPKLRRIDPLIRRAEERRDAVAREFARRTQLVAQHEQRLGDLLRFTEEYAQWPQGASINPAQLANREAFRARLGEAVTAQRGQVDQVRSQAEMERARLNIAARETKVYHKLADRYRAEIREEQDRREQKSLDEHALRTPRRHPGDEDQTP